MRIDYKKITVDEMHSGRQYGRFDTELVGEMDSDENGLDDYFGVSYPIIVNAGIDEENTMLS